jgi:hypothetical protein
MAAFYRDTLFKKARDRRFWIQDLWLSLKLRRQNDPPELMQMSVQNHEMFV